MEFNPLEISVDLGNLPDLLRSLNESIRVVQAELQDIRSNMHSQWNKHESMVLKQSIIASEMQECETRGIETFDALRNLQNQMTALDQDVKTLSATGLDNSLRIDQLASVSKTLEKDHIDIMHESKLHFLKVTEMLGAARNCESSWMKSSEKVDTAISRIDALHSNTSSLQEQTQVMIDDFNSHNTVLYQRIESALREIDAKCQSSLAEFRREQSKKHESSTGANECAIVSRMYKRIIADLKANHARESFTSTLIQEWRSETLKGSQRNLHVRRIYRIFQSKMGHVFDALRLHNREAALMSKLRVVTQNLTKSHQESDSRVNELVEQAERVRDHIGLLEDELRSCSDTLEEMRSNVVTNSESSSIHLEQLLEERLSSMERRLLERIEHSEGKQVSNVLTTHGLADVACNETATQIQDMLKDLLILWSSLREVDARKMDKDAFNEEIGSVTSQMASIKAEMMIMKNVQEKHGYQCQSTSTLATLNHHPSDTLITSRAGEAHEGRSQSSDVENPIDLAKSILSKANPPRNGRSTQSRPTSSSGSKISKPPTNTNPIHIVARKIL